MLLPLQVTDLLYQKQTQLEEMAAGRAVQQMTHERELTAAKSEAERTARSAPCRVLHSGLLSCCLMIWLACILQANEISEENSSVVHLVLPASLRSRSACGGCMSAYGPWMHRPDMHLLAHGGGSHVMLMHAWCAEARAGRTPSMPARCCQMGTCWCPWMRWGSPTTVSPAIDALDTPSRPARGAFTCQISELESESLACGSVHQQLCRMCRLPRCCEIQTCT